MSELDLNKPAGVLVKTTCVDFPGRVAGSFFLKGCNIRCPYCYNIGLVLTDSEMPAGAQTEPLNTVAELCDKSPEDMMKVRNLGRKSMEEVEQKLSELGLSLKMLED